MVGEKRLAIVIGKYKNPRCFKNENISRFKYYSNKKAWMTSEIFKKEVLLWYSELRIKNRKILLLIDNCSSHPDINNLLITVKLVFLPANTTSKLQPMDQGDIRNFKLYYKKRIWQILCDAHFRRRRKCAGFANLKAAHFR
jgi:hypothetical protein